MWGNHMHRVILSMALLAILAGCAETLSPSNQSQKPKAYTTSNRTPVIVTSDEMDISQLPNAIRIDENSVVVMNDINREFETSTIKGNRAIGSRALTPINTKSTGVSQVVERIYYKAGEVGSYATFEYDATGIRTKRTYFNASGIDGLWFTADDVISNYSLFNTQQGTIKPYVINHSDAGPDTIWFTADDVIEYYMADIIDLTTGAIIAIARHNSTGVDGTWFTADDEISFANVENTLADGSNEWIQYRSAGADMDWATLSDNEIRHYSTTSFTATGDYERHVFYVNPGPDGLTYSSDDVIGFYHDYAQNAQNLLHQSIKYIDPGIDAIWFTADDPISRCGSGDFNADNKISQWTNFKPGIDLLCFTTDDVVSHYHNYFYDATGHLLTSNTFLGSGLDTTWFTEDDNLVQTCKLEAI